MSSSSRNASRNSNEERETESGWSTGSIVAGAIGVASVLAGALYMFSKKKSSSEESSENDINYTNPVSRVIRNISSSSPSSSSSTYPWCTARRGSPRMAPPENPVINNLNSLLSDIYVRYIALKDDDFELYYRVFFDIFYNQLHRTMKEIDPYYRKYSSAVQFAGSHYDRLRINKPDEFDMDIVIRLPLNSRPNQDRPEESDIILESKGAGFTQLKMGAQFLNLLMRDDWETNKTAYKWKDDSGYLLQSHFLRWFESVVKRALNQYQESPVSPPTFYVDNVPYTVRKSASGPAVTLIIENVAKGFKLDVDLVPALRFPEDRWPINKQYMKIPEDCKVDYWMVVPKPNKASQIPQDEVRSWRIALHNQERKLMHDTNNMRQAIRLIKKLRDSLGMTKIASYYIKTLFFWEVVERNDPQFWWTNNPATLFKLMVDKFYIAMWQRNIPYFWNRHNNLIANVHENVLRGYASKLSKVIAVLESPSEFKRVAQFILTPAEFKEYNNRYLHI